MINLPFAMIFAILPIHLWTIYDIVWGACSVGLTHYLLPHMSSRSQASLSLLAQPQADEVGSATNAAVQRHPRWVSGQCSNRTVLESFVWKAEEITGIFFQDELPHSATDKFFNHGSCKKHAVTTGHRTILAQPLRTQSQSSLPRGNVR